MRVSIVAFEASNKQAAVVLNGEPVIAIHPDLTAARSSGSADLTESRRLKENRNVAFMGNTKGGAFDIPGDLARRWLDAPLNPNGRANAEVLRPYANAVDMTRRNRDVWVVDFGWEMSAADASIYELPFQHVLEEVQPVRRRNARETYRKFWWRHVEPRQGMWRKLSGLKRYLATPVVSKHRLFRWFPLSVVPANLLDLIARDDDTTFGILHSRFHELWSLRMGTWLGKGNDPRYTPTTTFETFPFPEGLTPNIPAADYADDLRAMKIAEAAARLNELRENWLNPADLVKRVPEVVEGYPDRILPVDEAAAKELKKRTLTNLYNQRPAWLDHAHRALDEAVAEAYGWPADLSDDEILAKLFELNQARAAEQEKKT